MSDGHALPGLDRDGFIERRVLAAKAHELGRGFLGTYSQPALLFVDEKGRSPSSASGEMRTPRPSSSLQIVTLDGKGSSDTNARARLYLDRIGFLVKRPANPFPDMISFGRAASCDLVVELETLSKVHGYFLREPDHWLYTDYRSTNGTLVNGKRVEKGERRKLADGDLLQFGTGLHALFLASSTLYDRLRRG